MHIVFLPLVPPPPPTHTHTPVCLSFIMEEVDLVIVGAEGVAESGGVINKVNPFNYLHKLLQKR